MNALHNAPETETRWSVHPTKRNAANETRKDARHDLLQTRTRPMRNGPRVQPSIDHAMFVPTAVVDAEQGNETDGKGFDVDVHPTNAIRCTGNARVVTRDVQTSCIYFDGWDPSHLVHEGFHAVLGRLFATHHDAHGPPCLPVAPASTNDYVPSVVRFSDACTVGFGPNLRSPHR